jgi:RNA polymerase sigma-70 factor (ECF subfamily)
VDCQQEFLRLFLRHQADVKAFIGSLIRDRHTRDDVFQEVALVLWQEFARYDRDRSFGAWARGIAAKKIMQRWEKTKRLPIPFSPQALQAVLDAYERTQETASVRAEALQECMERLPEKARRLLALRYDKALRLDQIARRLGATLDAVHKALSRIRLRLQKCVERRLLAAQEGTG